jgi:hypothetical protein
MGKKKAHLRNTQPAAARAVEKSAPEPIYCISTTERPDRAEKTVKIFKNYGLACAVVASPRDTESGVRGCRRNHLAAIRQAYDSGTPTAWFVEDDIEFKNLDLMAKTQVVSREMFNSAVATPRPPSWSILFLGANVQSVAGPQEDFPPHSSEPHKTEKLFWVRLKASLAAHCYCLNRKAMNVILTIASEVKEIESDNIPFDVLLDRIIRQDLTLIVGDLEPFAPSYCISHPIAFQRRDTSAIENRAVDYVAEGLLRTNIFTKFREAEMKKTIVDGRQQVSIQLLPDERLPTITLITPTYNRARFFRVPIYHFLNLDYPTDKITWVIVDDGDQPVRDLLPDDARIRYIRLKKQELVSVKRNIAASYASGEYLISLDDDDSYDLSYARTLVSVAELQGARVVGCSSLNCYDLVKKSSFKTVQRGYISEASMAYRRDFWRQRQFNERCTKGEGIEFLINREHEVVVVPSDFIITAMTHKTNFTQLRQGIDKPDTIFWSAVPDYCKQIYSLAVPDTNTEAKA